VVATRASHLYFNQDVSPYGRRRDREVCDAVAEMSVECHGFWGTLIQPPGSVYTHKGTVPRVFSAFEKAWHASPFEDWPSEGRAQPASVSDLVDDRSAAANTASLDEIDPTADGPQAGGAVAHATLARFEQVVDAYPEQRDVPSVDGTSRLSADLHFGTLSPRTVLDQIGAATAGRAAFCRQLVWRDWWSHLLFEHPRLVDEPMDPRYAALEFDEDPRRFAAWTQGQIGVPFVDAGMRQLLATGWMHNRLRMVTGSYLVKHLHLDWRVGERWFRRHLLDADLAQNVGNWQWVAGVGPDAAPYFRIFNPVAQGQRFDPQGTFIQRWVPELAGLSGPAVHEPWKWAETQAAASGYPRPLVDLAVERTETLRRYKHAASGVTRLGASAGLPADLS
jgi:deoxyribodipyrimidine photo-lyase